MIKYIILVTFMLFLNGCDFKKVDEGKTPPKEAMKCGAGKCGAKMINTKSDTNNTKRFEEKSPMKCGAGKCGSVKIELTNVSSIHIYYSWIIRIGIWCFVCLVI